jgi:hypothetical protein
MKCPICNDDMFLIEGVAVRCRSDHPVGMLMKFNAEKPAPITFDYSKIEDLATADTLKKFEASVWTVALSFCNSNYSMQDLRKIFYNKRADLLKEPRA